THGHPIKRRIDSLILRRIARLVSTPTFLTFAAATLVPHRSLPAPRALLVVRLVEHLRVHPPSRPAPSAAARPQRIIRILRKNEVMRPKAGVDRRELLRLRVVHRQLPP